MRDTTNDTETPHRVTEQIEPGAITTSNDTPTKQTAKRRWSGVLVAAAAFGIVVVAVGAAALLASGDDAVTAGAGPITFKVRVNLVDTPVRGTFEVTAGADVLGCSSGALVQRSPSSSDKGDYDMSCESGPNAGTFTIVHGGELWDWSVLESSGDFAGLQGEGHFDFVFTSKSTITETFTGDIEYTP